MTKKYKGLTIETRQGFYSCKEYPALCVGSERAIMGAIDLLDGKEGITRNVVKINPRDAARKNKVVKWLSYFENKANKKGEFIPVRVVDKSILLSAQYYLKYLVKEGYVVKLTKDYECPAKFKLI